LGEELSETGWGDLFMKPAWTTGRKLGVVGEVGA
jgi:hypothetical protein